MDENWHPGHLCCFYCDESLSQQKFVTVDGRPACVNCYDKNFANNCENCNKVIGPGNKDVDVRGKHWHEECFACSQSDCKKPLVCKLLCYNPIRRLVSKETVVLHQWGVETSV